MIKDFLSRIFSFKINEISFFNPFIRFQVHSLGDYSGINEIKRETPIIISLQAQDVNVESLELTIYSLLNQNLKPDRIILWLDSKYQNFSNLPYLITQFIKNGLEIRFVDNLNRYTKTIAPLKEFRNSILTTVEAGYYYNPNWLKKLYHSYIAYPNDIHVHLAKQVKKSNTQILSSKTWQNCIIENASYSNFIIGKGGILYPPNCFSNEVFRDDIYLNNCSNFDELWFWVMALVKNRKIRLIKNHNKFFSSFYNFDFLSKNNNLKFRIFDNELENLMKYYSQNILNKLS